MKKLGEKELKDIATDPACWEAGEGAPLKPLNGSFLKF